MAGGGFCRDRRLGRAFAIAIGQRGWKRQPEGGARVLTTSLVMLITSSNLVDCWTGGLAAWRPLVRGRRNRRSCATIEFDRMHRTVGCIGAHLANPSNSRQTLFQRDGNDRLAVQLQDRRGVHQQRVWPVALYRGKGTVNILWCVDRYRL